MKLLRILGIGKCGDLAALYLALAQRGHAVRVFVADLDFQGAFAGLLERMPDWHRELGWVRAAGSGGVVLFEAAACGAMYRRAARRRFQRGGLGGCRPGAGWGRRQGRACSKPGLESRAARWKNRHCRVV